MGTEASDAQEQNRSNWNSRMNRTHEPASEAMAAGEVWQPVPYPKRCSICGGTGRVYVKINGMDAVKDCECKKRRMIEASKKGKRKR